ncbi:MAG: 4'-phosphopantetheinyl transferase family protein [Stellaceae bacterium]
MVDAIPTVLRQRLSGLMDAGEEARALRFVRTEDRHSFTAAHGAVRLLLGAMIDRAPAALRFVTGEFGKPRLADAGGIEFNMSHSGGIVLIALASGEPVGIDVERVRPIAERAAIIERYLHPGEAADLAGFADGAAELAFFRCWSRKEAVVKALGRGMNLDLNRYRVACAPSAVPAVLALEGEETPGNAWSLADLAPSPAHVAAVATRRRPARVSCHGFDAAVVLGAAGYQS